MRVCVFCSSSEVGERYQQDALLLGKMLAEAGHHLIYGGSTLGNMGRVCKGALDASGSVCAVIPKVFTLAPVDNTEHVEVKDLRERKQIMDERSDAFIVLPGGLGTLDELADALTSRYLCLHKKQIIIVNSDGFFTHLLTFLKHLEEEGFCKNPLIPLLTIVDDVAGAVDSLITYTPIEQTPLPYRA